MPDHTYRSVCDRTTYVTTKQLLSAFGLDTLCDLPDIEALEDAGLLSRREMAGGVVSGLRSQLGKSARDSQCLPCFF